MNSCDTPDICIFDFRAILNISFQRASIGRIAIAKKFTPKVLPIKTPLGKRRPEITTNIWAT
jgi:hypothetical protein